jgi:uncharacterized protein YbjQ (UPF0145 family)
MGKAVSDEDRSMVEEIELHVSPWVSGTRSTVYFGTITSEFFLEGNLVDDCAALTKAEHELLDSLGDKARALGANAVLALEMTLDPFARSETGASGTRLYAVGTAVRLESVA